MNKKSNINLEANKWIIKINEGLNQEEKAEFEIWLKDKNNKNAYENYKNLLKECLELDDDFINDLKNEALRANNAFYKSKFIAASVVFFAVILIAIFKIYSPQKPSFSQNLISKNEKILNIILPDNSLIDLDVKSEAKVDYYDDKRFVEIIKGIAFFDVAKDKTRAFIVKAGKIKINAIGTKFEVINLNENIVINLLEGMLRINYTYDEKNDKSQTIKYLQAAQSLTLDDTGKVIKYAKTDINKMTIWKKDIIEFNKTTLKQAFEMFERYSNQKAKFQTKELSLLKISGKFSTLHYDSFLESIELIYPVKVLREKNNIKIIKNKQ